MSRFSFCAAVLLFGRFERQDAWCMSCFFHCFYHRRLSDAIRYYYIIIIINIMIHNHGSHRIRYLFEMYIWKLYCLFVGEVPFYVCIVDIQSVNRYHSRSEYKHIYICDTELFHMLYRCLHAVTIVTDRYKANTYIYIHISHPYYQ